MAKQTQTELATQEAPINGQTAIAVIDAKQYAVLDPASNVAELVAMNLAGDDVSEFDLDMVKVPSGGGTTWIVPSLAGDEETKAIEGIIVHIAKRRQYWASSDPTGDPPDCYSRDMLKGIGNPGGECETCPMNQFGSAKNERGKACKEVCALFIVRASDHMPIVVNCPPGSLKNIKQYRLRLPLPYFQVVTRLELSKVQNKDGIAYSEIRPSMVGKLPAESIDAMRAYAGNLQKAFA